MTVAQPEGLVPAQKQSQDLGDLMGDLWDLVSGTSWPWTSGNFLNSTFDGISCSLSAPLRSLNFSNHGGQGLQGRKLPGIPGSPVPLLPCPLTGTA